MQILRAAKNLKPLPWTEVPLSLGQASSLVVAMADRKHFFSGASFVNVRIAFLDQNEGPSGPEFYLQQLLGRYLQATASSSAVCVQHLVFRSILFFSINVPFDIMTNRNHEF